jgi:preprotein translocase subunit Sec61beta
VSMVTGAGLINFVEKMESGKTSVFVDIRLEI